VYVVPPSLEIESRTVLISGLKAKEIYDFGLALESVAVQVPTVPAVALNPSSNANPPPPPDLVLLSILSASEARLVFAIVENCEELLSSPVEQTAIHISLGAVVVSPVLNEKLVSEVDSVPVFETSIGLVSVETLEYAAMLAIQWSLPGVTVGPVVPLPLYLPHHT
jgi:hypothetical protein